MKIPKFPDRVVKPFKPFISLGALDLLQKNNSRDRSPFNQLPGFRACGKHSNTHNFSAVAFDLSDTLKRNRYPSHELI